MDLRAILTEDTNNNSNNQRSTSVHTPATPVTPVESLTQGPSRDYGYIFNHQVNSGYPPPQDYPTVTTPARQLSNPSQQYFGSPGSFSGGPPPGAYASPITQYQGHSQQQPPPPPLQVSTNPDLRSPAGSYSAQSAQSPYHQTPSSSRSNSQYPLPIGQTPQSPAQYHQYPPSFQHQHSQPSYPVPQTPPVAIPGSAHPLLQHQRSHSSVSTGTPTSSHSQPPYFNQPPTPTAAPTERQSERDRSVSVSPKTQPMKRKLDERADPPTEAGIRKMPKPQANGTTTCPPTKLRPKYYATTPIWAQSIRDNKGSSNVPRSAAHTPQPMASRLAPPAQIKQEPKTNGHDSESLSADSTRHVFGALKNQPQMTKYVADWLFGQIVNRDDHGDLSTYNVELEIEVKLGELQDLNSNVRLQTPAITESVVNENLRVGFNSSVEEWQHKNLNVWLNEQVKATHPGNMDAIRNRRPEVKYAHIKTVDRSYDLPRHLYNILPPSLHQYGNRTKLRISHDKKSGAVVATILKGRMNNLHLSNPLFSLDCRISVSFEMKFDDDVSEIVGSRVDTGQPDRDKDRFTYTLSNYQVDATMVHKVFNGQNVPHGKSFEVEIEVAASAIREEGQKVMNHQDNRYVDLVEGLLDNYRVLVKAADAKPPGR
ncbi:CYTH-like domain-containing protein [Calycina marina]|uniref:mRNA-capping enzyme subunit beta n=1 Tax=Calycina marina TaxID=1763456 RepID=A0A9P8CL01_9HELO|nr:CYTH-like domain-containing protein [Calycina marina]